MSDDGANSGDASNIAIGQIVLGAVVGIIIGVLAGIFVRVPPPTPPTPVAKPRLTHYHYAPNGMKDEEWRYQKGRLASHNIDRNLDGTYDYWAFYDTEGGVERVEEDNNFDGKADAFWTYSNGDIVGMQKDTDFNGVPDEFCTYKSHLVQEVDVRPNGSLFSTCREFLSNGVVTEIWYGGDSNGNFKEKVVYDPFFNPIHTNSSYLHLLSVP
jgi:hypothetical protein